MTNQQKLYLLLMAQNNNFLRHLIGLIAQYYANNYTNHRLRHS